MEFEGKKGFMYFFKVKPKKDDGFWKIATVGMVPGKATEFEFENNEDSKGFTMYPPLSVLSQYSSNSYSEYDFTRITETKIKDDEPLNEQLYKVLKKLLVNVFACAFSQALRWPGCPPFSTYNVDWHSAEQTQAANWIAMSLCFVDDETAIPVPPIVLRSGSPLENTSRSL